MAVSGLSGWSNIQGLQVAVSVPDEVYRGRETLITVRLTNSKRFLPSFLLRLELLGHVVEFPLVGGGQEKVSSVTHAFPVRGTASLGICTVYSPFPVGFFLRSVGATFSTEVTVFPAPLSHSRPQDLTGRGAGGELPFWRKGYEGDVGKINEYTGNEPMKMIHWRLSAKHDEFKVKEMTAVTVEPTFIEPLLLSGSLEERLAHAAYLINMLMREGRPVGLILGAVKVQTGTTRSHRLRLLGELSKYGQS